MNETHFESILNLGQCFLKSTTKKEFLIIIYSCFNMLKTDNNSMVQYVNVLGMAQSGIFFLDPDPSPLIFSKCRYQVPIQPKIIQLH